MSLHFTETFDKYFTTSGSLLCLRVRTERLEFSSASFLGIVLCIMFILPLLVMFLKEPLTNLVEKKPAAFEGGVGMFIVQGFFEMFEVLLSYFSNTLSFVRIGAYAVSHAAMMAHIFVLL